MVDVNLSEEEQVEALKKWWKENGRSVIAGLVLGLGGVFGWKAWTQHQQEMAEQASARFEQLGQSVAMGSTESAVKQAELLISDFGESPYAVFASLELAKVRLEQEDAKGVQPRLRWAIENSKDPSLRQIARLRLGRLMLSDGDLEGVSGILAQADDDSFRGEFAKLRGDLALAQGDKEAARKAYQEALDNDASNIALVQMKLDDLAVTAGP
jgi:predicted negative regulator of RcsB-dependent stress response